LLGNTALYLSMNISHALLSNPPSAFLAECIGQSSPLPLNIG